MEKTFKNIELKIITVSRDNDKVIGFAFDSKGSIHRYKSDVTEFLYGHGVTVGSLNIDQVCYVVDRIAKVNSLEIQALYHKYYLVNKVGADVMDEVIEDFHKVYERSASKVLDNIGV